MHRHTGGIQGVILEWSHQYLKWERPQAEEATEAGIEQDDESKKSNTEQGLEDLTIESYSDQCQHPPRMYFQEFENGYNDLVGHNELRCGERDISGIFDFMRSFKHTLRRVNLDFPSL